MGLRLSSDFPASGGTIAGALVILGALDVSAAITVDTINERSGPGGVVIEGITLNDGQLDLAGPVVVGSDPGGAELVRVGGAARFTGQLVSTLVTGTAPFSIASSTVVPNLNADLLDGFHEAALGRLAAARTWVALQTFSSGLVVSGAVSTLDELDLTDLDATPIATRRLQTIDGIIRASTTLDVEGRFLSRLSLEPITDAEVAAGAALALAKLGGFGAAGGYLRSDGAAWRRVGSLTAGVFGTNMGGAGGAVAAGETRKMYPYRDGMITSIGQPDQGWAIPVAGTLRSFFCNLRTGQPASGSLVFTVRLNDVDTVLAITIPAGGAVAVYSNTVNNVPVAAGDLLEVSVLNNATSNSGAVGGFALELAT